MKNFDSIEELKCYNLARLFNLQKLLLREIRYYLNNSIYDRNDIYFRLEELETVNLIISKKIERYEKRKNKFK